MASRGKPAYWRHSNRQLWEAYDGVCAYLAIYFEWVTGTHSTDHFVAKSRNAGDAYEWHNYRLSCLAANRNKGTFDDILDPIGLEPNTFVLDPARVGLRMLQQSADAPAQPAGSAARHFRAEGFGGV